MDPASYSLLIWTLLFAVAYVPAIQERTANHADPAPLVLTNERLTGSFPISSATLDAAPPILKLAITQVDNPKNLPFQIFAYFSCDAPAAAKSPPGQQKFLVGNFGLYPSDSPAAFVLPTSAAFNKLKACSSTSNVRLLLEIRRIHERSVWTPLQITIAPPEWRSTS
jgi:hypothetical protein